MNLESIVSVLTLLGIGGICGNFFRILWERKNTAILQKQEFMEKRYKAIVLLMLSCLDFEKEKIHLHESGRQYIKSLNDLKDELRMEWNNMILFASEDVLVKTHAFLQHPSQESYQKVALAMRCDLWGGKISTRKLEELSIK